MTTDLNWVPASACILPTTEQPLRVAEFDGLFGASLAGAERIDPTHARLVLAGGPDLADRSRDLAARETGCCSFFTFTIDAIDTRDGRRGVRMDIAVPPAHTAVLEALVARAESARAAAQADS